MMGRGERRSVEGAAVAGKPKKREVVVDRREAGLRLDLFLANNLPDLSRKQAKRLVDGRRVAVNGRIEALASRELAPGERVSVLLPEEGEERRPPAVTILYEDGDCLVVAKPPGLPSGPTKDPARPHAAALAEALTGRRLTLLHRLDRDTSGALLLAKTSPFAQALTRAFRERTVEKGYLALARGRVPASFEVVLHLKEGAAGRVLVVRSGGVRADTAFRTLAHRGGYSLVEARPRTGRMHQIRVQLAHAGHPILGDSLYGGDAAVPVGAGEEPVGRQMLHAWTLAFDHPTLARRLRVEAPVPDDFRALAEALFGKPLPLRVRDETPE
jgi:23S rRNA pseudouridine1911/1915/1917 synthase